MDAALTAGYQRAFEIGSGFALGGPALSRRVRPAGQGGTRPLRAGSRDRGLSAATRLPLMEAHTVTYTSPLAEALAADLLERFQRYVRVDTQSARDRTRSPSTPGQLDLARMLVEELHGDRARRRRRSTTTAT